MSAFENDGVAERRSPRVPLRVQVRVGEAVSCQYAVNISESGVCLQLRTPLKPGSKVQLRFQMGDAQDWIDTAAEVVWCACEAERALGLAYYETGLRFLGLSHAQLEELRLFVARDQRYCSQDGLVIPAAAERG